MKSSWRSPDGGSSVAPNTKIEPSEAVFRAWWSTASTPIRSFHTVSPRTRANKGKRKGRGFRPRPSPLRPSLECLPTGSHSGGGLPVWEIARAKRLAASLVVAVKRRDGVRATSILCFLWGAEPQPKMERVHWLELRVLLGVLVVHLRRFHNARSKYEQLFAEDASGAHLSLALVVGREVCLVPGDAKGA